MFIFLFLFFVLLFGSFLLLLLVMFIFLFVFFVLLFGSFLLLLLLFGSFLFLLLLLVSFLFFLLVLLRQTGKEYPKIRQWATTLCRWWCRAITLRDVELY